MTGSEVKGAYISRFEDPTTLAVLVHLIPEPEANERPPRDILEHW
jgi:hypothetical protein